MFMQDITRFAATPVTTGTATLATGLLAGALVDTETGWRPVETLRMGDRVHTLEGGLQRIAALSRREVLPGEPVVRILGGHFDVCDDVMLMPGQGVLLDTLGLMAAPYAHLRAEALCATIGATRTHAPRRIEVVTPIFAEEEAIWAQSGLLVHCPGLRGEALAHPCLSDRAATLLVQERNRRFA